MKKLNDVKFEGYKGKWYEIDAHDFVINGQLRRIRLMEHCTYGDEVASLVVDERGNVIGETMDGLHIFMRDLRRAK